jgi:glycosyltransferase involved in cell wall biosynthesis
VGAAGIDQGSVEIIAADHRDMPAQVARMSAGMALIKPAYSKIASAPTKLAEYLGCGVPCLGNAGVGDMAEILEGRNVGVAVKGFSTSELADGVQRLAALVRDPATQARCRQAALDLFSVEAGAAAYAAIYDRLAGPPVR